MDVTRGTQTTPKCLRGKVHHMSMDWPDQTDKQLADEAQTGLRGQGAVVEANCRLRNSIEAMRRSTDRYSGVMVFLTVVLTILTALLVYKEFWGAL